MTLTSPKSKILLGTLAVVLVVVGVAGFLLRGSLTPHPAQGATAPISPEIEARWGVRVTQIGVTADGGLVDFRYIVLDSDKALEMQKDVSKLPVLVAESSGTLVNSAAAMTAKHDLNVGQTYFLLYRNTNGAIKSGTPVTVKFGDMALEHMIAK